MGVKELNTADLVEYGYTGFDGKLDSVDKKVYRLKNDYMEVLLSNFGPTILAINVPKIKENGNEHESELENILLGHKDFNDYLDDKSYIGKIAVGQWANRISNAEYFDENLLMDVHRRNFKNVKLFPNDGPNNLHSEPLGWSSKMWDVRAEGESIVFSLNLKEGNHDFPGNIKTEVKVSLSDDNELKFEYIGETDKSTPFNPTFHGYFNLSAGLGTIKDHVLTSNADRYMELSSSKVPVNDDAINEVSSTRYDFRKGLKIGSDEFYEKEGYDSCLVFPNKTKGIAEVYHPGTKRFVEMTTDQKAFHFYTGYWLEKPFNKSQGFCLEAERPVDIVNRPNWWAEFGTPFTQPKETYEQKTTYKFGRLKK